jgi:hypothetical protein
MIQPRQNDIIERIGKGIGTQKAQGVRSWKKCLMHQTNPPLSMTGYNFFPTPYPHEVFLGTYFL